MNFWLRHIDFTFFASENPILQFVLYFHGHVAVFD